MILVVWVSQSHMNSQIESELSVEKNVNFLLRKPLWKIFKNKDFGFEIFEKGQILRPFSDLSPSKRKYFPKRFKGRLCVYKVIV